MQNQSLMWQTKNYRLCIFYAGVFLIAKIKFTLCGKLISSGKNQLI